MKCPKCSGKTLPTYDPKVVACDHCKEEFWYTEAGVVSKQDMISDDLKDLKVLVVEGVHEALKDHLPLPPAQIQIGHHVQWTDYPHRQCDCPDRQILVSREQADEVAMTATEAWCPTHGYQTDCWMCGAQFSTEVCRAHARKPDCTCGKGDGGMGLPCPVHPDPINPWYCDQCGTEWPDGRKSFPRGELHFCDKACANDHDGSLDRGA